MLARFAHVGVDNAALGAQLQTEGAQSFDKSWNELMDSIASKGNAPGKTTQPGEKR
jgi:transaldolase